MYKYYLGLGSNLGEIVKNIDTAIKKIEKIQQVKIVKIAPYYFNPPFLPPEGDESYYHTFCNTCIELKTSIQPFELLNFTQQIEVEMGRKKEHLFWSPRIIDIDMLYCEEENGKQISIDTDKLLIPHKELFNRSFVLDPLSYLAPTLKINNVSVLKKAKTKKNSRQFNIMAIVNITNDSFSGDGIVNYAQIENKIKILVDEAIPIIDIGCEATNAKAKEFLTSKDEIEKLTTLNVIPLIRKVKKNTYSTKFSIDTYHVQTAKFCIENGFDIINDVNGFKNEEMWQIMADNPRIEAVIMHSLTPHTDKQVVVDKDIDIISYLNKWILNILNKAKKYNIPKDRIILDYGIGFNKSAWQSLQILKNFDKINNRSCRTLIGHSRKSFMSLFTNTESVKNRSFETLGCSVALQQKGVDILRVHDAIELKKLMCGYYNII